MFFEHLIFSCCAFSLCVCLTALTRKIVISKGWIEQPSIDRWHKKNTALFGGVAIFSSLIICWLLSSANIPTHQVFIHAKYATIAHPLKPALLLGSSLLFIMGLFDDFKSVKPYTKLTCQVLAALLVVIFGHRLHWFPFVPLDIFMTLLWIIGITNAFNLIDNMDGLCAGVSLIVSLYFAFWFSAAQPEAALIAVILAGASAGFLMYNFNPAKIFMGDCGSQVLGFSVSILAICFSESISDSILLAIAGPIMILIIPVFDTVFVTLNRISSRRSIFMGGCDHTSHRLVSLGFSEKKAVLLLYGVACVSGLVVILIHNNNVITSLVILAAYFLLACFLGRFLSQKEGIS